MKHLKTYKKLFESSRIEFEQWEDVKDIIQSEILDKYHISIDDVDEKLGEYSGQYGINDPIYALKFNNLELSIDVIDDIYGLNRRIKELTGNFIIAKNNVNRPSKGNIEIELSKTPDSRIVREHFNLEECDSYNGFDKMRGGLCDYETAVKILEWLNTFYTFCYRTEFEAFELVYNTFSTTIKNDVQIVFSMPRFEDKRFSQVVCFELLNDSNSVPVFTINTNYTDSPSVRFRRSTIGRNFYNDIPCDKKEKLLSFLNKITIFTL